MPQPNHDNRRSNKATSEARTYGQFEHLGSRSLTVNGIVFRGRLLRSRSDNQLRFVVNRQSNGTVPADWPHKEEWVVVTERDLSEPNDPGPNPI